jgi:hypothetical protein
MKPASKQIHSPQHIRKGPNPTKVRSFSKFKHTNYPKRLPLDINVYPFARIFSSTFSSDV